MKKLIFLIPFVMVLIFSSCSKSSDGENDDQIINLLVSKEWAARDTGYYECDDIYLGCNMFMVYDQTLEFTDSSFVLTSTDSLFIKGDLKEATVTTDEGKYEIKNSKISIIGKEMQYNAEIKSDSTLVLIYNYNGLKHFFK